MMLAMVADIAIKAVTQNSHLVPDDALPPTDGALPDVLAQTQGVVLIDELDVHLHPRWQRGRQRYQIDISENPIRVYVALTPGHRGRWAGRDSKARRHGWQPRARRGRSGGLLRIASYCAE